MLVMLQRARPLMSSIRRMFHSCFGKHCTRNNNPLDDAHGFDEGETAPSGSSLRHVGNHNVNLVGGPNNLTGPSEDLTCAAVQGAATRVALTRPGDATSDLRTRLNALQRHEMDPEKVVMCEAAKIMSGLRLMQRELGRGTYGIVVTGTYLGVSCAVKVMLSTGLGKAALRELLLGPSLVHPHIVSTFATRAAHLTDSFFDRLEGDSLQERDPAVPRALQPLPIQSGDGFGDPKGLDDGLEPLQVLHQLLHALRAEVGKVVVIVVQEYCDRGTLDNAIKKHTFEPNPMWGLRLARRTLLRTAGEMARGLLHLHDNGVIHGDLKPANVLLNSSEEDRRGFSAKLGDFGLSHVLPDLATSLMTRSWGSVAYMAPEAFDGKVSLATDVWAFGVCLWEMLTGWRPYRGMTQEDVISGLQDQTLSLPWPDGAPMAAPIISLGRRCLSFTPGDRPSFKDIVQEIVDIERAIRQEAVAPQRREGAAAGCSSTRGSVRRTGGITGLAEL